MLQLNDEKIRKLRNFGRERDGFTLLEVLAFGTVMGIALTGVIQLTSYSLKAARNSAVFNDFNSLVSEVQGILNNSTNCMSSMAGRTIGVTTPGVISPPINFSPLISGGTTIIQDLSGGPMAWGSQLSIERLELREVVTAFSSFSGSGNRDLLVNVSLQARKTGVVSTTSSPILAHTFSLSLTVNPSGQVIGCTAASDQFWSKITTGGTDIYNTDQGQVGVGIMNPAASYQLDVSGGNTNLRGRLTVGQATRMTGTLTVGGASTLQNTLSVAGSTALQNTLTTSGATTLGGSLTVAGATSLNNQLTVANGNRSNLNSTLQSGSYTFPGSSASIGSSCNSVKVGSVSYDSSSGAIAYCKGTTRTWADTRYIPNSCYISLNIGSCPSGFTPRTVRVSTQMVSNDGYNCPSAIWPRRSRLRKDGDSVWLSKSGTASSAVNISPTSDIRRNTGYFELTACCHN